MGKMFRKYKERNVHIGDLKTKKKRAQVSISKQEKNAYSALEKLEFL